MMNRPPNNIPVVKQLVKSLYNYDIKQIKELNGYDDRNYYLLTTDSKEFVLKITNKVESGHPGVLDAINAYILHLYNNGFKVTVPQLDTNGKYVSMEAIPEVDGQQSLDKCYGVRLLEYISGKLLKDVPFSPDILTECGQVLAKISIASQTFDSPVLRKRRDVWSLLSALDIRQHLDAVDNLEYRHIVSQTLDEFDIKVMQRLDTFEQLVIHGDFNEMNIIVHKTPDLIDNDEYHVKGIIDFNDIYHGPRIFDLAIYLAYSMLLFTAGPKILAPGFGLKGFMQYIQLTDHELNVLITCMKTRLCQSLVMGAHSYRLDPTNTYVLSSATYGWPALIALHNCDSKYTLNKWLDIDEHL